MIRNRTEYDQHGRPPTNSKLGTMTATHVAGYTGSSDWDQRGRSFANLSACANHLGRRVAAAAFSLRANLATAGDRKHCIRQPAPE
jgi:hypothetical protein